MFSILLSSYFIYNSVGNIDEAALQSLSLVINLAKEIKMKDGDNDIDDDGFSVIELMFFRTFTSTNRNSPADGELLLQSRSKVLKSSAAQVFLLI